MRPAKTISNKIFLFFWLLLGLTGGALGQNNNLDFLQTRLNQYRQKVVHEKIFVHTDKDLYLVGEIMWFKLYNVEAAGHQPLDLSKVAYLEILDQAQQPILQTKLSLDKGSGQGSLYIPVTLPSGNYQVRAYTNWMKNFSPDYYFEKVITIVNTLNETEIITPPVPVTALDIQFSPEGGNLLPNVPTRVGFRAVDQQGHSVPVSGEILNEKEEIIMPFRAGKFGIGSFTFTPAAGINYQARIQLPSGKTILKNLPAAAEQGYGMQVNKTPAGQVSILVTSHAISNPTVYLLAHTRHEVKVAQLVSLQNNQTTFLIDENQLGDGISHFTLFNQDKKPVAERLYFKRPSQILTIQAATDKTIFTSRQQLKLSISTQTVKDGPIPADLSVSVFRTDMPEEYVPEILSYLYLSSDLSGPVESPDYYFRKDNSETDAALDNLMLTQGWRRFRWNEILQEPLPAFEFVPEYEGHIVTGSLKNKKTGLPISNLPAFLSVLGTSPQFYTTESNTLGQLKFFTRSFYGNRDIVVQANSLADSLYNLNIATPFSEKYSARKLPLYFLPDNLWQGLLSQSISMQAQNLFVADKITRFNLPTSDSATFYGKPYKRYLLDNYTRFPSVEEVLREFVNEVAVRRQANNYVIKVLDLENQDYFENSLVLLDGVPILGSQNKFIRYDSRKIKKVEVVPEKYVLGNQSFNGIANFTTYKGNLDGYELNPQALVINYEGLQMQREFYAPHYENATQVKNRAPDFRNLLFWSPAVKTDNKGNAALSFYTSDQVGKYLIVVQGLTAQGQAGSKIFSIVVKESL